MLAIGDKAPDVSIKAWPDYKGPISKFWEEGPLILFFYPMDNTPTCTKQACTLRDNIAGFGKYDANVLGSSTGSMNTHKGYAQKHGIQFPLVSDKGSKLAKAYRADRFLLPISKRITYVIAKGGTVAGRCHNETSVAAHMKMIDDTLIALAGSN
ncbi:MAG: redoxin domain-containing protein [Acidobacteriota bacterium]|nr:redoxin domain-containing protein [Acidobacteriota bacterium]